MVDFSDLMPPPFMLGVRLKNLRPTKDNSNGSAIFYVKDHST
jgi:hypothetical protein